MVIGGGIVGLTSAYALARKGYRVTVIDKLPGVSEMCSRANAGIIAVGHAHAWAEPQAIASIFRALLGREPSVKITRLFDPQLWRWGLHFLRHCTSAAHRDNSLKLLKLSMLSSELLARVEDDMQLERAIRHQGGLYLYKDAQQFERKAASLDEDSLQVLNTEQLIRYEPWLMNMRQELVGGILSPRDGVGDCYQFSQRCYQYLNDSKDVEFMFGCRVHKLEQNQNRIVAVQTDRGRIPCQQVLLATGIETPELTASLGFKPLIYPVKGYSGTWQISDPEAVPRIPFVDESEFLAVGSYGGSLRVTAIAEFAGRDTALSEQRLDVLQRYVQRHLPDAVDTENAQFWTGMRPTTPTGVPYLGRVRHLENLWLNAGHGQLGWTMSMGCAQVIAQLMSTGSSALSDVSIKASWLQPA